MAAPFRLHLEGRSAHGPALRMDRDAWDAAAARHAPLAGRVAPTFGLDGDGLAASLETADALLASTFDKGIANAAPRLAWIHTTGAGVDTLAPLSALREGLVLTNSSGIHGDKAEDYVRMALLMLQARVPELIDLQRTRTWRPPLTEPIRGRHAVVVGYGDVGRAAGRAALSLGLRVTGVTRTGTGATDESGARIVSVEALDAVLPEADFVVVAAPLTDATRGLIDARRLALLRDTAGLVNIGRAAIVDVEALRLALEDGRFAGAVLDVFDPEPLPPESPLWTTPRLVVTPHVSCDAPDYAQRVLDLWFANFERLQDGLPLANIVDRARGY